jgi:hypothetical protein
MGSRNEHFADFEQNVIECSWESKDYNIHCFSLFVELFSVKKGNMAASKQAKTAYISM